MEMEEGGGGVGATHPKGRSVRWVAQPTTHKMAVGVRLAEV